jgi:hypothetical protein
MVRTNTPIEVNSQRISGAALPSCEHQGSDGGQTSPDPKLAPARIPGCPRNENLTGDLESSTVVLVARKQSIFVARDAPGSPNLSGAFLVSGLGVDATRGGFLDRAPRILVWVG